MVSSAFNVSLSGLAAASKRLEISANNVANQFSTKTIVDGKTVDKPYTPQKVDLLSLSGGGVQAQVSNVNPATVKEFNPQADNADSQGVSERPNVDPAEEFANQLIASQTYKANLKAIRTQSEIFKNLLDIET